MNMPHEFLHNRLDTITALDKLLKDIDPVSCASVCIRRGVARDNPDVENDAENRPWITVELSDLRHAHAVIELLLDASKESALFWRRRVLECRAECEKAVARMEAMPAFKSGG